MALGRKNALIAGADSGGKHWAIVATLIQTAKLNCVFRRKPAGDSDAFQPVIPTEASH